MLTILGCSPVEETTVVDGPAVSEIAKPSTSWKAANGKPNRKKKSAPKSVYPALPTKKPTQRRKRSTQSKVIVSKKNKIRTDQLCETEEEIEA